MNLEFKLPHDPHHYPLIKKKTVFVFCDVTRTTN